MGRALEGTWSACLSTWCHRGSGEFFFRTPSLVPGWGPNRPAASILSARLCVGQVNEAQVRLRDLTRRLMATVSELALCHAHEMQAVRQREQLAAAVAAAAGRIAAGLPPTQDADEQLRRVLLGGAAPPDGGVQVGACSWVRWMGKLGVGCFFPPWGWCVHAVSKRGA
jgi:hypothetical protein